MELPIDERRFPNNTEFPLTTKTTTATLGVASPTVSIFFGLSGNAPCRDLRFNNGVLILLSENIQVKRGRMRFSISLWAQMCSYDWLTQVSLLSLLHVTPK